MLIVHSRLVLLISIPVCQVFPSHYFVSSWNSCSHSRYWWTCGYHFPRRPRCLSLRSKPWICQVEIQLAYASRDWESRCWGRRGQYSFHESDHVRISFDLTYVSLYIILNPILTLSLASFSGYCAFTHKAGIHAKAILNNPSTYEILRPEDFGLTRYVSIGYVFWHSFTSLIIWFPVLQSSLDRMECCQVSCRTTRPTIDGWGGASVLPHWLRDVS